ncbi:MAG: methyltransferase domain-containing protein [Caldithrix sp.]|nr:methyltransferase domain-containing protein [Caldithrix sp.]
MFNKYDDNVVATAQEYYNSSDADAFYHTVWGGEDIHIGYYQSEDDSIYEASRRTVKKMAELIPELNEQTKILDIGAGYGGAARYLAETYGCKVVALNLSEVENERDREKNREQGLDRLIDVIDASFEDVPYPEEHFDVVWSQDSILHSARREQVLKEVARVLKRGGQFVLTDPMMADDCPDGVLQPILDRIHLESLASPGFYRKKADELNLKEEQFVDLTNQLVNHYGRVLKETEKNETELKDMISDDYINNMKKGLNHWVNGGRNGYLTWGIFRFAKQ